MKKLNFYTRRFENGQAVAVLVPGYTDETFNYYKTDHGYWWAVHPGSGLAVPGGSKKTRREAVTMAHNYTETIHKNITTVNAQILIFNDLIREAQNND